MNAERPITADSNAFSKKGRKQIGNSISGPGARSKKSMGVSIEDYCEEDAIHFEQLDPSSFAPGFFDQMEQINYSRYIEQENYVHPQFLDENLLQ